LQKLGILQKIKYSNMKLLIAEFMAESELPSTGSRLAAIFRTVFPS